MVGGRVGQLTGTRKRRGMYASSEESRREFARWLGGPLEVSRKETVDPRTKSLAN